MQVLKTILSAVIAVAVVIIALKLVFWLLNFTISILFWIIIGLFALPVFFYVRNKLL